MNEWVPSAWELFEGQQQDVILIISGFLQIEPGKKLVNYQCTNPHADG